MGYNSHQNFTSALLSTEQQSLLLFRVAKLPARDGDFGGAHASVGLLHPAVLVEAVVGVVVAGESVQAKAVAIELIGHASFKLFFTFESCVVVKGWFEAIHYKGMRTV